jgi:hypothetical protein
VTSDRIDPADHIPEADLLEQQAPPDPPPLTDAAGDGDRRRRGSSDDQDTSLDQAHASAADCALLSLSGGASSS